jgi:hypothetical protein
VGVFGARDIICEPFATVDLFLLVGNLKMPSWKSLWLLIEEEKLFDT